MHFDDKFFAEIGLAAASQEEKLKLADEIAETVQNRVSIRLAEILSEDQLASLDKKVETGDDDHVEEYLVEVYPHYPELIQEELAGVKAELSHSVAMMRGAAESSQAHYSDTTDLPAETIQVEPDPQAAATEPQEVVVPDPESIDSRGPNHHVKH